MLWRNVFGSVASASPPPQVGETYPNEALIEETPDLWVSLLASTLPNTGVPVPGLAVVNTITEAAFGIRTDDPGTWLRQNVPLMAAMGPVETQPTEPVLADPGEDFPEIDLPGGDTDTPAATDPQKITPVICIYHTHSTEAFEPDAGKGVTHTSDLSKTIVVVGDELTSALEELGATVIHSRIDHVANNFNYAYTRSRQTADTLLQQNPGLSFLIDIHRDGAARKVTTTKIAGQDVAKIYIVIGRDHPGWEKNYSLALRVHNTMEKLYPGVSRGVLLRDYEFNQGVSPQSILIEIGGNFSSLAEANRTARYLAQALYSVAIADAAGTP
jgi:stage II sporulation protein P